MYFVNSAELTYVFCQFRRINYKLRRIDICIILLNYQYHKNTFANSAELSISQGKIGRNVFFGISPGGWRLPEPPQHTEFL